MIVPGVKREVDFSFKLASSFLQSVAHEAILVRLLQSFMCPTRRDVSTDLVFGRDHIHESTCVSCHKVLYLYGGHSEVRKLWMREERRGGKWSVGVTFPIHAITPCFLATSIGILVLDFCESYLRFAINAGRNAPEYASPWMGWRAVMYAYMHAQAIKVKESRFSSRLTEGKWLFHVHNNFRMQRLSIASR